MADWQDNEFISGTRFRFFHAPPLPPPIPEPVVELFQQSQQTSVDISAAVSRQISEQLPDEEDEVGSIVFEDDNMWKVTGYVDCKEVIVHVDSEEHSVSIRDCAGYKAPTVVIVRGVCRNLIIANCINVVVIMDGARGSAILHTVLELSLYFCGFCPSPLTLREIDGLQYTAIQCNLHCSISVTKGDDIFFKCLDDGWKPPVKKKSGWGRRDSESEDGSPERKADKKEFGGGTVLIGHMSLPQRRHVQLPAKQLITMAPSFTTAMPREGVFVMQEGRLTKSADHKARGVLTHAPRLVYNGAGHPLGAHPPAQ